MASLVLICQRCSTPTAAEQMANGHCAACRIETVAAVNRRDVLRLYRKRRRYQGAGTPLFSLDRQLQRVLRRVWSQIETITKDAKQTQQHFDALMVSVETEGQPILSGLIH